jgi:uncharacterized membrane protein YozB (DUF420 family)
MRIVKDLARLFLLVITTTIGFIAVSALLPFSQGFKAANSNAEPGALLYVLLVNTSICLTIMYIARHSPWHKAKLMAGLTLTLFFVYSFMMQIETYFFAFAFPALTDFDVFLIALANGIPIFIGVPLGIRMFARAREKTVEQDDLVSPSTVGVWFSKILLIGFIYVIIYFVFGYFVAWQSEDLRLFYSGNRTDEGFIASLITNYQDNPGIYPFQFLRGVLFALSVLPLVSMFKGKSTTLLISLMMVMATTAMGLIIPNFLFPDAVRWAHFREMISSMLVFAVVIWFVYDKLVLTGEERSLAKVKNQP